MAKTKYSTYDRELLAIYNSIKHFKHMLEGRQFSIYTDRKPLITAFHQKNEKATPEQLRHLDLISQFATDIRYISGTKNVVADTLSRVSGVYLPDSVDYDILSDAQDQDDELLNLLKSETSLKLQSFPVPNSKKQIYCDVSTGNVRPYIPKSLRKQVFLNLHNLCHPGQKKTCKLVTDKFVWPHMKKECNAWTKTLFALSKK